MKGLVLYAVFSKLRNKNYLTLLLIGIGLWISWSFYSPPVDPRLYEGFWVSFFLFAAYFALISTLNSIGKDRERGYTEMLFSRPISSLSYLFAWWISFLIYTLIPMILFMFPVAVYFHGKYGLRIEGLGGMFLSILLIISYSLFFSTFLQGNSSILLTLILLFFTGFSKNFPISSFLFPKVEGLGWKFLVLFPGLNFAAYIILKRRFP